MEVVSFRCLIENSICICLLLTEATAKKLICFKIVSTINIWINIQTVSLYKRPIQSNINDWIYIFQSFLFADELCSSSS